MKFDPLFVTPQWLKEYHTKYPNGMSVLENIIEWVNKTNVLIDWANVTPEKTEQILTQWQESGLLNNIISEALQTEIDLKKPIYSLKPSVVAHRNLALTYPENTIYGAKKCVQKGLDIEFDVRWTLDNTPVVIHDPDVDRTTDGSGYVSGKTLSEIKALDAGSWFSNNFAGLKIPTLEEYLDAAQGVNVYVDIKDNPTTDNLSALVDLLIEKGYEYRSHIQLAGDGNFGGHLQTIRSKTKNISVLASIFFQQQLNDILPYLLGDNRLGVSMSKYIADESNLNYLRSNRLFVIIATLTNAVEKADFLNLGYTTLMSDYYMEV